MMGVFVARDIGQKGDQTNTILIVKDLCQPRVQSTEFSGPWLIEGEKVHSRANLYAIGASKALDGSLLGE